ncbi:acyl-CoA dehydrogenase family protein [Nocardia aurantia]|uniref:Acyl-CoA dehydrogenase fadE12 n=1 Tax=Nocardia aurantia TaxID=2585199 RepID=A0A7K0E0M4_9NOCA|nr:acyl-CoA dehydrogenase family protein [Nocardia aurantia]MQY31640.1 Acyl-CoA dehydrogenase fadE12 [Nocardia aurantia]
MTVVSPIRTEYFELPTDLARLHDRAQRVAAEFADRAAEVRRHLLEHAEMHPELWQAFRDNGWTRLALPDSEGGLLGLALVLEAFAAEGIVLWLPVLSTAIAHAVAQAGPADLRAVWLPRIADGSAHLGMAATEQHSGHNLFGVRTEIRRAGDHFTVSGVKRITSALDVVDRVLVFGRDATGSGHTCVLLDPRAPGASITEIPMRFREGVRQFELALDEVAVPADALVGEEGRGTAVMWPFTHVERTLTAALCVGTAAYSLTRAVDRARRRTIAADRPIGAHQAVAHPLAGLHARLSATRLLVHRTAARIDAHADPQTVAGDSNAAKVLAADLAFDAADRAVQTLGADAWDERNGWLDVFLDARLSRSGPVSNEFALNHIAQHVLGLPPDTAR